MEENDEEGDEGGLEDLIEAAGEEDKEKESNFQLQLQLQLQIEENKISNKEEKTEESKGESKKEVETVPSTCTPTPVVQDVVEQVEVVELVADARDSSGGAPEMSLNQLLEEESRERVASIHIAQAQGSGESVGGYKQGVEEDELLSAMQSTSISGSTISSAFDDM